MDLSSGSARIASKEPRSLIRAAFLVNRMIRSMVQGSSVLRLGGMASRLCASCTIPIKTGPDSGGRPFRRGADHRHDPGADGLGQTIPGTYDEGEIDEREIGVQIVGCGQGVGKGALIWT
jgi:hypothetical protein